MGKAFVRIFFQDFQGLVLDSEDVDSWVWKVGEVLVYYVKFAYNCWVYLCLSSRGKG